MTYEDIVTLAKAGFTAEQIARLSAVQNTTQPTVPTAPVAQPTVPTAPIAQPTVPTAPIAQPTVPTAPIAQPTVPAVPPVQGQNPIPANSPDYILQAINNVNDTMRQMQINMTNQPKVETTDDIIASIINPPMPSKEGDK